MSPKARDSPPGPTLAQRGKNRGDRYRVPRAQFSRKVRTMAERVGFSPSPYNHLKYNNFTRGGCNGCDRLL